MAGQRNFATAEEPWTATPRRQLSDDWPASAAYTHARTRGSGGGSGGSGDTACVVSSGHTHSLASALTHSLTRRPSRVTLPTRGPPASRPAPRIPRAHPPAARTTQFLDRAFYRSALVLHLVLCRAPRVVSYPLTVHYIRHRTCELKTKSSSVKT